MARMLFLAVLAVLGFGLSGELGAGKKAAARACSGAGSQGAGPGRAIFVAGDLSDDRLISFTANLAASRQQATLLIDSQNSSRYQKAFLAAYRPEQVIAVGSFPAGIWDLERRLGIEAAPGPAWKRGWPVGLWKIWFPRAERVVVCPAESRPLLLQAACLAGALQAPLVVTRGKAYERADLGDWLARWQTKQIYAVGVSIKLCRHFPELHVVGLKDQGAVAAAYLRQQGQQGPIRVLVVANPADAKGRPGGMSALAPWVALQRRAALLLTDKNGDNVAALVRAAVRKPALRRADTLLLLADLEAIPMERRPNPIPSGKDPYIEMEPLTPRPGEAFTFATGRLFGEDPSMVALLLARQQLLAEDCAPRRALVVSNPNGNLPLLEALSRNTANELRNGGYETTALFANQVDKDQLRRLLPQHGIFLWEGHYNTLVKDYGLPDWSEPLPPALLVLQSCLALNESKAQPLLQRGGVGVIGSSSRIYSGSGGAFTLAFFDALLYEKESVGAALRHAKNFLLAYSLLKEKRLGKDARLSAANLRSAWAFSLWGDPTLQLPRPPPPDGALPPVHHAVRGRTIILTMPPATHDRVDSGRYKAEMFPNARLAGLSSRDQKDDKQRVIPFLFAEVHLPKAPPGKAPHLRSRLPQSHWVFCWDQRRRTGYLLVVPRNRDRQEIRFHVDWKAGSQQQSTTRAQGATHTGPE